MITLNEKQVEELQETLHDELVEQVKEGDTTVLFEIIKGLNINTAFWSLSDEAQQKFTP